MSMWDQHSWWHTPQFDTEAVARCLEIQPDSVRRYQTQDAGFPKPAEQRGGRNYWTPASMFARMYCGKPALRQRVPRLCPVTDIARPAQFVEARAVELHGATYALHVWEPGDDRGLVGVAYSDGYSTGTSRSDEAAERLIPVLPHLSAVAVATALPIPLPAAPAGQTQPHIYVAERTASAIYPWQVGWFDLAPLLRVDLPWWSYGLTELEAILAWRPNQPLSRIRPRVREFSRDTIERCRPRDGGDVDRALGTVAGWLDRQLADICGIGPYGYDHNYPPRPGLTHAAVADVAYDQPDPPDPVVIRRALRHRVDDEDLAYEAVNTARSFLALLPVMTGTVIRIDRDDCSRLAHEWCHRLVPAAAERRGELGYTWVRRNMADLPDQHAPHRYWRDPLNSDVWAISATDGTMYATVGTRMPASGRVEEVAAQDRRPFFRDSAGATFPVPVPDGDYHRIGYDGSGPADFTALLLALKDDAAADVRDRTRDYLELRATGLCKLLSKTKSTTISRADLETLAS